LALKAAQEWARETMVNIIASKVIIAYPIYDDDTDYYSVMIPAMTKDRTKMIRQPILVYSMSKEEYEYKGLALLLPTSAAISLKDLTKLNVLDLDMEIGNKSSLFCPLLTERDGTIISIRTRPGQLHDYVAHL
jgi:hypothetical protein